MYHIRTIPHVYFRMFTGLQRSNKICFGERKQSKRRPYTTWGNSNKLCPSNTDTVLLPVTSNLQKPPRRTAYSAIFLLPISEAPSSARRPSAPAHYLSPSASQSSYSIHPCISEGHKPSRNLLSYRISIHPFPQFLRGSPTGFLSLFRFHFPAIPDLPKWLHSSVTCLRRSWR